MKRKTSWRLKYARSSAKLLADYYVLDNAHKIVNFLQCTPTFDIIKETHGSYTAYSVSHVMIRKLGLVQEVLDRLNGRETDNGPGWLGTILSEEVSDDISLESMIEEELSSAIGERMKQWEFWENRKKELRAECLAYNAVSKVMGA